MVTDKHATEDVKICVHHQAKRVYSRAILFLIAPSVGAHIIWIIKQKNTNIAKQTKQIKLYTFHPASVYS